MKLFRKNEAVVKFKVKVIVTRWQLKLFGWHFLSVYRWRFKREDHWWFYIAQNVGIGFHMGSSKEAQKEWLNTPDPQGEPKDYG